MTAVCCIEGGGTARWALNTRTPLITSTEKISDLNPMAIPAGDGGTPYF